MILLVLLPSICQTQLTKLVWRRGAGSLVTGFIVKVTSLPNVEVICNSRSHGQHFPMNHGFSNWALTIERYELALHGHWLPYIRSVLNRYSKRRCMWKGDAEKDLCEGPMSESYMGRNIFAANFAENAHTRVDSDTGGARNWTSHGKPHGQLI